LIRKTCFRRVSRASFPAAKVDIASRQPKRCPMPKGNGLSSPSLSNLKRAGDNMTNPAELETKFWKALKSDRTVMLGVSGIDEGHTRPMTAQIEGDEGGPIWFFTATDNDLVRQLRGSDRAILTFASKGHDVFAGAWHAASRYGSLGR